MSTQRDYWQECISIAAEECDLKLTPEQLAYLAEAVESGHEHYGQAFYSPPPSDRLDDIEREWKADKEKLLAKAKEEGRAESQARIKVLEDDMRMIKTSADATEGICDNGYSAAYLAEQALLTISPTEALGKVVREAVEKDTFNDREEAIKALRKMNDGKVYLNWHEEGGAIVHKCESEFFVFEVPIYGGMASFSGRLTRPEEVVALAFSWT